MGGFLACHRFVSHVTGFATFFGYEINQTSGNEAIGMLAVPLFFLFGVMISGFLVDLRLQLHKKPRYYMSFGIIFILTLIVFVGGLLGEFGKFGEPLALTRDYVLLGLLCLICGIQNGTITTVSRSVVRTTHLTGITTDLGIGLVRQIHRDLFHDKTVFTPDDERANVMRLGIIAFFIFGSVVSGFAFIHFQFWGFIIPVLTSGLLSSLMLYFQVYKENQKKKLVKSSRT